MKILADASLPHLKTWFNPAFLLSTYKNEQELCTLLSQHDILICRSTLRVDATLLANSPIQAVATASSGTDHVDISYLKSRNIPLFDAKGANAHAVADYVMCVLASLQSCSKLQGMQAAVIGMGAVGVLVAARLEQLQFKVHCYDPLRALFDPIFNSCSWEAVLQCDVICIHANLHDEPPFPSKHLFNADCFAKLKPQVVIINAARGGIVDEADLLSASCPITYCTDVYHHEPEVDTTLVQYATICTPHIAGHSKEAKSTAIEYISRKIHHHYQLPFIMDKPYPEAADSPTSVFVMPSRRLAWEDFALAVYNPMQDTMYLKNACNKERAFVQLRTGHYRHDFCCYAEFASLKHELNTPSTEDLALIY